MTKHPLTLVHDARAPHSLPVDQAAAIQQLATELGELKRKIALLGAAHRQLEDIARAGMGPLGPHGDAMDLLYGVPAISDFLGMRERQVYHLVQRNELPSFKIGGKVCARRSLLAAWLAGKAVRS